MQSRQQVLDYIARNRVVTVVEISHALRMTENNAKHHLKILQEQGIVEVTGTLPVRSRGRPAKLYALSDLAHAHSLDCLSRALFAEVKRLATPEEHLDILNNVAKTLIQHLEESKPSPLKETSHITQRLFQAMVYLNQLKFQARWEARTDGAHIIFDHCPYMAILNEHPELCQIDQFMLQNLLNTNIEQTAKLALDTRGMTHCIFHLKKLVKSPSL